MTLTNQSSKTTSRPSSSKKTRGNGGDSQPRRPFGGAGRARGLRTRPRSRGLIAAAVVLVLAFGLATAYFVRAAGDKVSVLTIGAPVAKGQVVEREALVSTMVAGVSGAIPVDQAAQVIGKTASVDLVEGQVLTEQMVTSEPTPAQGEAVVGLALEPTKVPAAGIEPGDLVQVLRVTGPDAAAPSGPDGAGTVISARATVYDVAGDVTGGSAVLLTLVLPEGDAAAVAAASTAGQAAVVEIFASSATTSSNSDDESGE